MNNNIFNLYMYIYNDLSVKKIPTVYSGIRILITNTSDRDTNSWSISSLKLLVH